MKICIIGCGYVGSAAARLWKQAGHEITVTTRSLEKGYKLRAIADLVYILADDWHDLVEKQDVVLLSVAADSHSDYLNTYLHSAEKLLKALPGSQVKKVFYTSSFSVYGDHKGEWVDEKTACKPMSANAQILLSTEDTLLKAANEQCTVSIFRLGEVHGPGRDIVERLKAMPSHKFSGTGENYTNLSHLTEILSGLDLALKEDLPGVYNLCNDLHITRKEFYTQLCLENEISLPEWDPQKQSPHGGNKRVSNERLKEKGWHPLPNYTE